MVSLCTEMGYDDVSALYAASGLSGQARLRLVGVRATGLVPAQAASTQMAFGDRPVSWRAAETAMDRISGRFGTDAVRPAALVERQGDSRGGRHQPDI